MVQINWFRYIPLLIISTSIFMAFSRGLNDIYGILIALAATLTNQYFLVQGVRAFVLNARDKSQHKQSNTKVILLFLGKFLILFAGFYFAYTLMGKHVILPIINYVILIFVLTLSIRGFKDIS